jgi:hypothetical protein
MGPMYVGWKCFPHKKALISSLIFTANGTGSIIYSIFASYVVNPNNEKTTIGGIGDNHLYYSDVNGVASNTKQLFRVFAYIAIGILVITTLTIYIPPTSMVNANSVSLENTTAASIKKK